MKALVYTGTHEVVYRDEPDPVAESSAMALVKIDACGLCGSDMHAYHGHDARRVPPLILGHEATGVVTSGSRSGERVILNPLITCGSCEFCLAGVGNLCSQRELIGMRMAGAFAEQVLIPERNLMPLPAGMDAGDASLTEPTAVSLHSVRLAERVLQRPVSESRAVIIGAGAIGVLAALVLASKGCDDIFIGDTNALRRSTAEQNNWGNVYDPVATEPAADSFDLVIDAVGSGHTRKSASRLVKPGGVICHAGLQDEQPGLDTRKITLQEITVIGNYTYTVPDLYAATRALQSGKLGGLDWVERRALSEGAGAFADVHNGTSPSPKIILFPS